MNIRDFTLLEPINDSKKRFVIPFNSNLVVGLDRIVRKAGFDLVFKSMNTLRQNLGSPKDKIEPLLKSGIYSFKCDSCESMYIGQSRRSVGVRGKEHLAHFKNNRFGKSSVADHILETEHPFPLKNLSLVKEVNDPFLLNPWESLYIQKFNKNGGKTGLNILNSDNGPIVSSLFDLI